MFVLSWVQNYNQQQDTQNGCVEQSKKEGALEANTKISREYFIPSFPFQSEFTSGKVFKKREWGDKE